ncbi:copper transporter [Arcanobacterium haemolyticum]|nr:copper transporter [Arcanobacterium haemolyticum]
MIDFRYHLVSLVSVFLALAVGIILGAGPLQNSIGNTLNSQVETLRESRDDLRTQLDTSQAQLDGAESALEAAAGQLLPGTLTNRNVAIVALPGVENDAVASIEAQLQSAGATTSASVTLTDAFASSDQATYRSALASQMSSYVSGVESGASNDAMIASALDYLLRTDPNDANAKILLGSLTAEGNQLMNVTKEITAPASVVVYVAPADLPAASTASTQNPDKDHSAEIKAQSALYAQVFSTSAGRGPAVGVGSGTEDNDILRLMRAANVGSTVDSVGTKLAAINTAFAAASELSGTHIALGTAQGAQAALGTRVDASAPAQAPAEQAPADQAQG